METVSFAVAIVLVAAFWWDGWRRTLVFRTSRDSADAASVRERHADLIREVSKIAPELTSLRNKVNSIGNKTAARR